jgi:deoxyribodipyrimidine photo-lyase
LDPVNIFWFRRDLRLNDNAGLYSALSSGLPVISLFIFDTDILNKLKSKTDARVEFIHNCLEELNEELGKYGSSLLIEQGKPVDVWKKITGNFSVNQVYTNHDYEPYAINRDIEISKLLASKAIKFNSYKDQVIFEMDEILNKKGNPYTIYTPYSKAWLEKLNKEYYKSYNTPKFFGNFYKGEQFKLPSLKDIGFKKTGFTFPSKEIRENIIKNYHKTRDYPFMNGTSRLSVHLRFGTISIRSLVKEAVKLNDTWLKELIWREFFMQILYNFPAVVNGSFRKEFDGIKWRNNEKEFSEWREGKTGYPIVDAGMRELNRTGYMHNRVRMITASFLVKHLLVDWRRGERCFAEKLLDYDMASNNGNWQWAAGTGCDAAPYFRVFNPAIQAVKFDPDNKYIRKWIPELESVSYPKPVVEHAFARKRAIETYKKYLKK